MNCLSVSIALAADHDLRQQMIGNHAPVLRVNAGGPIAHVTSVVFSPDGETLYAAGWDKVVHVWELGPDDRFYARPEKAIRVPIAPGEYGMINAMAISPDGRWLAVGGISVMRGSSRFRDRYAGLMLPKDAFTPEQRLDRGTIYVFDTADGQLHRLVRACRDQVVALAFLEDPGASRQNTFLVAAAQELADPPRRLHLVDIDTGKQTQSITIPGAAFDPGFPAIVGRLVSNGLDSMQIVVAWGDDQLWMWRPTSRPALTSVDNVWTFAVSSFGANSLLVGSHSALVVRERGKLNARSNQLVDAIGQDAAPTAITTFRSNGLQDHVALIIGSRDKRSMTYSLVVARTTDWKARLAITIADHHPPRIATAPTGQFVAVIDNVTQQLQIYRCSELADFRQERPTIHQILQVPSPMIQRVSFATDGQSTGLILRETSPTRPGTPRDIILDLESGQLVENQPWKPAVPAQGGWHAAIDQELPGITATRPDGGKSVVELPISYAVNAFAICPVAKPIPLIAVAANQYGRPKCDLFDAVTGTWLRRLSGPLQLISSVAFSPDGKLLAAVSGDRTVYVWWLSDLGESLGKRGMLRGLVLQDSRAGITIKEVDDTQFPGTRVSVPQLAVGDVVRSLRVEDQIHEFRNAWEFYMQIARQAPGQNVTLVIDRQGVERNVEVTVGQAVDERKPHFSLYLSHDERDSWSWIGWTPLGLFESSDRDVEESVGWHFNTDKQHQPVEFASLSKYGSQRSKGLLAHLLTHETPPLERNLPDPEMSFHFRRNGEEIAPDNHGHVLMHLDETIDASVLIHHLAPVNVESVFVRRNDGHPIHFIRSLRDPGIWSHRLTAEELQLRSGVHYLDVVMLTSGSFPREFRVEPAPRVRVQRAAPALQVTTNPPIDTNTVEPVQLGEATLAIGIAAPDPSNATIQLRHRWLKGEKTIHLGRPPIQQAIELLPGTNAVVLEAVNPNPLQGYEQFETQRLFWNVNYNAPKPPIVVLDSIEHDNERQKVVLGEVVAVDVASVTAYGRIETDLDVKQLELVRRFPKPFAGGALQGKVNVIDNKMQFNQSLDLEPGRQTFEITARTAKDEGRAPLDVYYRPLISRTPPKIALTRSDTRIEPDDDATISVTVTPPADAHDFKLNYVVNGTIQHEQDGGKGLSQYTSPPLQLGPGPNRVLVRLSNEWGRIQETETIGIHVLRRPGPPQIELVYDPQEPDVCSLRCQVASPLEPTRVHLLLNGQEAETRTTRFTMSQPDNWEARVDAIPLRTGNNRIRVQVENADGICRDATELAVAGPKEPPPALSPPIIEIEAEQNVVTSSPRIHLRFQVQSPVELAEVRYLVNGRAFELAPGDGSREDDKTIFEPQLDLEIDRINTFSVHARDTHGRISETREVTLNVAPQPLRIEVDELTCDHERLKPKRSLDGSTQFPEVPTSVVQVKGRIKWSHGARPSETLFIKTWVNGFLQPSAVQLGIVDNQNNEQPFIAELTLNRRDDNVVVFDLPGVPSTTARVNVARCKQPNTQQRLDVFVVNIGGADLPGLAQQLDVFESSNAFQGGINPLILSGNIVAASQLRLKLTLHRLRAGESSGINSAFLFYFHGRMLQTNNREFTLLTNVNAKPEEPDPDDSLASGELEGYLEATGGAHLVFIDAVGVPTSDTRAVRWPGNSKIGVVRATWSDESPVPLQKRIFAQIASAIRGMDVPITFALLTHELETQYAVLEEVQFDAHHPETGIDALVLVD